MQSNHTKTEFVAYGSRDDDFVFIVIPGLRPENIPGYKIIVSDIGDIFISLNSINQPYVDRIHSAIENQNTITNYLQEFVKPKKTKYIKKKNIIIDSDSEDTPVVKPMKKKIVVQEEEKKEKGKKGEKKKAESKKKPPTKEKKTNTKRIGKVSITILDTP